MLARQALFRMASSAAEHLPARALEAERQQAINTAFEQDDEDALVDILAKVDAGQRLTVQVGGEALDLGETAARRGKMGMLSALHRAGRELLGQGHLQPHLQHIAAEAGQVDALRALLEWCRGDKRTALWETPLHFACRHGQASTAELLVQSGEDIDACSANKATPLAEALSGGHVPLADDLAEWGAALTPPNCPSMACVAARGGHMASLQWVEKVGLDLDAPGAPYGSAVEEAWKAGHTEAALWLADRAGSARTKPGGSIRQDLLLAACKAGDETLVRFALDSGTPASLCCPNSQPMHFGASAGCVGILQLLQRHHASPDSKDRWGRRPLHFAAEGGHVGAMRWLLEQGCSVNEGSVQGERPLHAAVKLPEAVALLLQSGAEPNFANHEGVTAFHAAYAADEVRSMTLLLWAGAATSMQHNGFNFTVPSQHPVSERVLQEWHHYTRYRRGMVLFRASLGR